MELVRGIPITEYCDQHQLDPRQRLELFVTVCRAVQHAHQKGIIHRDLKPSNVLVEQHDVTPIPKIIDFGVAKAIDRELTEKTLFTNFAQMIGTPLYMSPEQAELSGLDVDTRSDIYSLGVLLYELLTGTTPFDRERLHAAAYDELRRIIREEEPPRPSVRISSLSLWERAGVRETAADLATTVTDRRRTDTRRLVQTVRGDLDWVVMKCLEKDRNRRYESASGLAQDIERYLADEHVLARPPSRLGRATKWARRHRTLVASIVVSVATLVVICFIVLALSNVVITRERNEKAAALADRTDALRDKTAALDRAERNFQMLLAVIDRSLARVGDQTLADLPQMEQLRKKLLEDALEFYEQLVLQNPNDPSARFAAARVYVRAAMINQTFGNFKEAIQLNDKSIVVLQDLARIEPTNASYRMELGTAFKQRSWNAMSIHSGSARGPHWARRAVELFQDLSDENPDNATYQASLLESLLALDIWSATAGEREMLLARMVPLGESPQMNNRLRGGVKQTIAQIHQSRGRLDEAEVSFRDAVHLLRLAVDENPTEVLGRHHLVVACNELGRLLSERGKLTEAIEAHREALRVGEKLRSDFPAMKMHEQFIWEALIPLANGLEKLGRPDEAKEVMATRQPKNASEFHLRGWVFHRFRQYSYAVDDYERALSMRPISRTLLKELAWLLATAPDKRIRDGKRAVELATKGCELTAYKDVGLLDTLAVAYAEAGDYESARNWSNKAMSLSSDDDMANQELANHLEAFKSEQAWRED
jgi:tetratricopeptide (TPR) repeat protein